MNDLGSRLAKDEHFAYNTLIWVFEYLSFKDLLNCAQVCPIWQWIINEDIIWRNRPVYCCYVHIDKAVEMYGSKIKHLEVMYSRYIYSDHFRNLCLKMENLQEIALHGSNIGQLRIIAESNKKLERVYAKIQPGSSKLNFLKNFKCLTHLDILTYTKISDVTFMQELKHLKHLSFSVPCERSIWEDIVKLEGLESLCIDYNYRVTSCSVLFDKNFYIKQLSNLKKLQITNLPYFCKSDILDKVKQLPNLKELVLDNISISQGGTSNFGYLIGQCHNIERFTIYIHRVGLYYSIVDVALENFQILIGVTALKNTLKYFCWQVDESGVSKAEEFYHQDNITALKVDREKTSSKKPHEVGEVVPVTMPKLLRIFQKTLPHTEVVLLDPATIKQMKREKCCYECNIMIMTPQDRMKGYS